MTLHVEWIDGEREPQCQPNPDFPNGIAMRAAKDIAKKCTIELPYPARRCGVYVVKCDKCGYKIGLTTAGRPDDPRVVEVACYGFTLPSAQLTREPYTPSEKS